MSSLGRITLQSGLVSRGHLARQGYYATELRTGSLRSGVLASCWHIAWAIAFLGPPPFDRQSYANHKDLNKENNAVENLEWVSHAENVALSFSTSTRGRAWKTAAKPIWSRLHRTDAEWTLHHSMARAASELGLWRKNIQRCTQGKQRQTCGYEFQLADAFQTDFSLPGEEWRTVDLRVLERDKGLRRYGGWS